MFRCLYCGKWFEYYPYSFVIIRGVEDTCPACKEEHNRILEYPEAEYV